MSATFREGRSIKVILLGDANVGKTSIIQYIKEKKCANSLPRTATMPNQLTDTCTVGIETKGSRVKFEIWDTCGQEKYHSIVASFLRNVEVVVLVYDITEENTFNHIKIPWKSNGYDMVPWVEQIERQQKASCVRCFRFLAGHKSDLEKERKVTTDRGKALASHIEATFVETSAVTGTGINELFTKIAEQFPDTGSRVELHDTVIEDNIVMNPGSDSSRKNKKQKCC